MYIPPFVCGVLATIGCEILALFISAAILCRKSHSNTSGKR